MIEGALLHLVVGIWTQMGAWTLTAINVYSLLWMVGHFQAARLQPLIVDDRWVHLRTGLIWRGRLSLSQIAAVRRPTSADLKVPVFANASLTGRPNLAIILKDSDLLESLLGRKKEVEVIGISLDDPKAFQDDVRRRLESD